MGEAQVEFIALSYARVKQEWSHIIKRPVARQTQFPKLVEPCESAQLGDVIVLKP